MELYHHGVKGQKWGIRRYQNEDGSYKNGAEGRYYTKEDAKKFLKKADKAVSKLSNTATKIADKTVLDAKKELNEAFGIKGKKVSNLLKKSMEVDEKHSETVSKYNKMYSDAHNSAVQYKKRKEAQDYIENNKKEYSKTLKETNKANEKLRKEIAKTYKKDLDDIRSLSKEINSKQESMMNEAFKTSYKKNGKGMSEEDYYHYNWKKGKTEYDKALKDTNNVIKDLHRKHDEKLSYVGSKVAGNYLNDIGNYSFVESQFSSKDFGKIKKYQLNGQKYAEKQIEHLLTYGVKHL